MMENLTGAIKAVLHAVWPIPNGDIHQDRKDFREREAHREDLRRGAEQERERATRKAANHLNGQPRRTRIQQIDDHNAALDLDTLVDSIFERGEDPDVSEPKDD